MAVAVNLKPAFNKKQKRAPTVEVDVQKDLDNLSDISDEVSQRGSSKGSKQKKRVENYGSSLRLSTDMPNRAVSNAGKRNLES